MDESSMSERMQMLMHTRLLDGGLTYTEHKRICKDGCILCSAFRKYEDQLKNLELSDQEVRDLGLTREEIMHYRETCEEDKIANYYPDKDVIFKQNGDINRDVYLVLQSEGFTDKEIREYFGLNIHTWNIFKKHEFPNWKDKKIKEHILSTEGVAAVKRWRNSSYNKQIRVNP